MEKDFTIEKVGWHTLAKRNYIFDSNLMYKLYKKYITYLQENKLTNNILLKQHEMPTDDSKFMRSDLTEDGYEFYKKTYDKWSANIIDKGKSPEDVKYLDKKLAEIIEKK